MGEGAKGFVIAAPHSGSGKTLVTLGLCRAFRQSGISVTPAKSGPDYIDPHYLARAAGEPCINLDAWAMRAQRLSMRAQHHANGKDMLIVEGAMGLFDGAQSGGGSTADLAALLGLPVVLVIDCSHMAQSVAALAHGFSIFRPDVRIAGVILNRVASDKHEAMLRHALMERQIKMFGVLRRDDNLKVPGRHLGLVLPSEIAQADLIIDAAAEAVKKGIDLERLRGAAVFMAPAGRGKALPPLGQRIAIAKDAAFSFIYEHWLQDWRGAGAQISFFSPLADQAPARGSDAVFLPGGYPELHGAALAGAHKFKAGLIAARGQGALIYGECGGYMVLGEKLTDREGVTHKMAGLLPHATRIDTPHRTLGYRILRNNGPLPFGQQLCGHEFHYSTQEASVQFPLFEATNATGNVCDPMGAIVGKVCGAYAHVIDRQALR